MQQKRKRGRALEVCDGYLVCPVCRRNRKAMPVLRITSGENVVVWCRLCKSRTIVDIDHGLCFESLCRQ